MNKFKLTNDSGLNIIHINIQSIRNKLDDLNIFIQEISKTYKRKLHIIALSEIWIYSNENQYYNIDGYTSFFSNRSENRSGGCCIFVHDEIDATLIQEYEFELSNFLIVKLMKLNIHIACVYRYGDSNLTNFNEQLEKNIFTFKRLVLVGDININLNCVDHETRNYIDTFQSSGYLCLNKTEPDFYTRKKNSIGTYIDHVITNLMHLHFHFSLHDISISDHRAMMIAIDLNRSSTILNDGNIGKIRVIDYEGMNKNINELNEICNETDFDKFHNDLIHLINKNTKEINTKTIKKKKPWMNQELLYLIRIRDKYYKKLHKQPDNATIKTKYEESKRICRNLKNYLKKGYYTNLIEKNINDNKKTWKVLNTLIYNKSYNNENVIKQVISNSQMITNNLDIANAFNDHFINIVAYDPYAIIPPATQYENVNRFILDPCTNDEVYQIINNLNSHSSNGYDNISTKFIKQYQERLIPSFMKYINSMFVNGLYPESLKVGSVIPIFKSGDISDCSNYRPITKLSVIDKIFEQTILNRLQYHLENNKIIHPNQFGFTKNSNTLAACINCMEYIYEHDDNGNYVAIISIDLKKAFDSTDLRTLIAKLDDLNIKNNEIKLFESFLFGRKQTVNVNGSQSELKNVRMGIPQGSKLAATLFIIYINGIFKLNLRSTPQFYADDGLFKFSARSFSELMTDMHHDLNLLNKWFEENHLKLNITKTKVLLIDNHVNDDINHFIGMNFNGELIKRESTIKYLGLTIDDKFTWNQHINIMKNRLVALCFAIYRIKMLIPKNKLWLLYHAHFMSHISYLNSIWNKCTEHQLNEIQRLQNKIIKTIENKPRLTPTNQLYTNKLNIRNFNMYQTVLTIHKIKHKKLKFQGNLELVGNVQCRFLRNILNYRPNFFRKEKCKKSLMSNGIKLYNSLPQNIKEIDNIKHFKQNVQQYIIKSIS